MRVCLCGSSHELSISCVFTEYLDVSVTSVRGMGVCVCVKGGHACVCMCEPINTNRMGG